MKIPPFKEINPPNDKGYWINKKTNQSFGGQYASPVLLENLKKLEVGFKKAMSDKSFIDDLEHDNAYYLGLPTPVQYSKELTELAGGEGKVGKIYLKRTDLTSGGSHKPVNALGSVKLAKYLGYKRIYTETGAAQNSRAVAAACAKENMDLVVFIGEKDYQRVNLNATVTELFFNSNSKIIRVTDGNATLLPAMAAALRAWSGDPESLYVVGSVCGPHPYPLIVRTFQSVIGRAAKQQMIELTGRPADACWAVVGGGSNCMALMYDHIPEKCQLYGVESSGSGIASGKHAATISSGKSKVAIMLGQKANTLVDENFQVLESHSAAAGLDFSGTGPEISYLHSIGRLKFAPPVTDKDAIEMYHIISTTTGVLPALEFCYCCSAAVKEIRKRQNPNENHLLHFCGRGESNAVEMLKNKNEKK